MDASLADGLDLIRTETQRELRRYKRRIQEGAENEYRRLYNDAQLAGEDFDPIEAARRSLSTSIAGWLGLEPQKAIEG